MTTNEKGCWYVPEKPSEILLSRLIKGPFAKSVVKDQKKIDEAISLSRREKISKPLILVGTGTCGLGAGAGKTLAAIKEYVKTHKIDCELVEVGCIGICSEEPLVDIRMPDSARISYRQITEAKVPELLDMALKGNIHKEFALGHHQPDMKIDGVSYIGDHPFFATQKRWVLANCGIINPVDLHEYIARGGYSGLAKVIAERKPEDVADMVEKSGLRGRGGGGFSTGKKWKIAASNKADKKYLICNADEGDPGAFMDRAVIESDTFRLLEGMAIAAYAFGAQKAYVYIRAEYPLAIERLKKAIEICKEYNLLGDNILGSNFSLEILIKKGAGAFVCGEETALMHSIEGKRGMPRPRPPYPAQEGVFGYPTVINNVETLANVPDVVRLGADVFASIGTAGSKGTKVFALSGMVERTGLVEVPMGTTIEHIVKQIGGGIINGTFCKAVQMGGPSGGCIPNKHLDAQIDYESLKTYGAIMGSGGMVVMNEHTCMVDLAKYFMEFIQSESCGKCIPCREGTKRLLEILRSITRGRREESEVDSLLRMKGVVYLEKLATTIKEISLCGLGQTAPNPVLSTLRWFRDEYEAHIFDRTCPAGSCTQLTGVACEKNCPVGTEVWRYVANIGKGEFDEAYKVIRRANPFPSVCARVCHHPCEDNCKNGTTGGDPVAIRTLKRFVADNVDAGIFKSAYKKAQPDAKKIAIIGGGPSGLTAAHYLSLDGYRVTVFEKESILGGMLVCAIPEYRMPRDILQKEINSLMNENIDIRFGKELGKDFTVDELFAQGFNAVYIATGAHKSQKMNIEGEDTDGVVPGIVFLKDYNLRKKESVKGKVGIIGGGNSAIDAARVAVRQSGITDVTVFYRRTENEMPAYAEEIRAAIEEGVKIIPLMAPVKVNAKNGKLASVTFVRNSLGEKDSSGRQRPVPVKGSETDIPLDALIVAISEQPETEKITAVVREKWGGIVVDAETLLTDKPGVFAGGDAVLGPNNIIESIAAGKKAAKMIRRYVEGKGLKVYEDIKLPEIYISAEAANDEDGKTTIRVEVPHLEKDKRKGNFREVELCISADAAICEAKRCLRCDLEFTRHLE